MLGLHAASLFPSRRQRTKCPKSTPRPLILFGSSPPCTRQSRIKAHSPPNAPKSAPIQAPRGSIVAGVSVRFWRWPSLLLGCPSREAIAVYLAERKKWPSRIKAYGNKTESHGPNKAHMQQKKSGHSPWRLSRANRALVSAPSWKRGGVLGGSGWASEGRT